MHGKRSKMAVEVKICGLTIPADVEAVNTAGADYAGFVFYEKSKRRICEEEAEHLLALLDPDITSVAVCVSPDAAQSARIEALGFDVIQIHGGITSELLETIRIPVWQALNLSDRAQLQQILLDPRIDGYLIDGAEYGAGKTFGWEAGLREEVRQRIDGKRFILAGGLNPENVRKGIRLFAPDVVDVSSGVEWTEDESADADGGKRKMDGKPGVGGSQRGRKDPERVLQFVREVREA